jgi:hypothetical protein
MRLGAILLVLTMHGGSAVAQGVEDNFSTQELDWGIWCPCQLDMANAPIQFLAGDGAEDGSFSRIAANEFSLGGNRCRAGKPDLECVDPRERREVFFSAFAAGFDAMPEASEPLGPSLIEPEPAETLGPRMLLRDSPRAPTPQHANPWCTDDKELAAHRRHEEDECIQRQELRLQKKYEHASDDAHIYSLRFRMPATIEDTTNSIRWVTAQWKHEPVDKAYHETFGEDWGPSPFLAQRFDDGVLHITVQDEHCRCIVASAPNPRDPSAVPRKQADMRCLSTEPGPQNGRECKSSLSVTYGDDPVLSSARGQWVELSYRVQASRSGNALITVREGQRPIVEVRGKIGYKPGAGSVTKFKIGHYRDYMPFAHSMDIDRVSVRPVK